MLGVNAGDNVIITSVSDTIKTLMFQCAILLCVCKHKGDFPAFISAQVTESPLTILCLRQNWKKYCKGESRCLQ